MVCVGGPGEVGALDQVVLNRWSEACGEAASHKSTADSRQRDFELYGGECNDKSVGEAVTMLALHMLRLLTDLSEEFEHIDLFKKCSNQEGSAKTGPPSERADLGDSCRSGTQDVVDSVSCTKNVPLRNAKMTFPSIAELSLRGSCLENHYLVPRKPVVPAIEEETTLLQDEVCYSLTSESRNALGLSVTSSQNQISGISGCEDSSPAAGLHSSSEQNSLGYRPFSSKVNSPTDENFFDLRCLSQGVHFQSGISKFNQIQRNETPVSHETAAASVRNATRTICESSGDFSFQGFTYGNIVGSGSCQMGLPDPLEASRQGLFSTESDCGPLTSPVCQRPPCDSHESSQMVWESHVDTEVATPSARLAPPRHRCPTDADTALLGDACTQRSILNVEHKCANVLHAQSEDPAVGTLSSWSSCTSLVLTDNCRDDATTPHFTPCPTPQAIAYPTPHDANSVGIIGEHLVGGDSLDSGKHEAVNFFRLNRTYLDRELCENSTPPTVTLQHPHELGMGENSHGGQTVAIDESAELILSNAREKHDHNLEMSYCEIFCRIKDIERQRISGVSSKAESMPAGSETDSSQLTRMSKQLWEFGLANKTQVHPRSGKFGPESDSTRPLGVFFGASTNSPISEFFGKEKNAFQSTLSVQLEHRNRKLTEQPWRATPKEIADRDYSSKGPERTAILVERRQDHDKLHGDVDDSLYEDNPGDLLRQVDKLRFNEAWSTAWTKGILRFLKYVKLAEKIQLGPPRPSPNEFSKTQCTLRVMKKLRNPFVPRVGTPKTWPNEGLRIQIECGGYIQDIVAWTDRSTTELQEVAGIIESAVNNFLSKVGGLDHVRNGHNPFFNACVNTYSAWLRQQKRPRRQTQQNNC